MEGMTVSHVIVDGKDVQIRGTFTGVSLGAISISSGTATYWYTGTSK